MADIMMKARADDIASMLKDSGFDYLKVAVRGKSISIFSEYEGRRENRCRFTNTKSNKYELSLADRNGRWESTPLEGELYELLKMTLISFPWMFEDYGAMDN